LCAGIAAAVKLPRTFFKRGDHFAERTVEILASQRFEHTVLESEIDAKIDPAAAIWQRLKVPAIIQIPQRPIDILDIDHIGPLLGHL